MEVQIRIEELQRRRHELLERRANRDAPAAALEMELIVVRSELQALYGICRQNPASSFSATAS